MLTAKCCVHAHVLHVSSDRIVGEIVSTQYVVASAAPPMLHHCFRGVSTLVLIRPGTTYYKGIFYHKQYYYFSVSSLCLRRNIKMAYTLLSDVLNKKNIELCETNHDGKMVTSLRTKLSIICFKVRRNSLQTKEGTFINFTFCIR